MNLGEIKRLVDVIQDIKQAGKFPKFIDFIQFPKYRNLRPGTRINFKFPLTVLVGQNGTGKTSVLQALYGAPGGKSVGNWWFGTAVDPIDAEGKEEDEVGESQGEAGLKSRERRSRSLEEGERSAFWYGYHEGGKPREVLKTRIRRLGNPDYWEPSRPVEKYGMTLLTGKKRSPTIQMKVNYLNFKTNLNAFDRCFYFYSQSTLDKFSKTKFWNREGLKKPKSSGQPGKPRPPRIQDFLRVRSRSLKRALGRREVSRIGKNDMNESVVSLSGAELKAVSQIIGKQYEKGLLIRHRFYESWGTSVLFSTTHAQYTEAFAGSGEASVVRLVHEIETAEPGTLVLLDEPETSLHPGAQREVLKYLLFHIQNKKLQVVISTHSPVLVQNLPRSAIKVLSTDPEATVRVSEDCSPEEAFFVIGHIHDSRINVIVEDLLAKEVVEKAILSQSGAFASRFLVEFRPEGESAMKKDIALYIMTQAAEPYFVFDGDNKPEVDESKDEQIHIDPQKLTAGELTVENLSKLIKKQTKIDVRFREDSNMSADKKITLRTDYLKYYLKRVFYLPFRTPEEAIWNDDACHSLIKAAMGKAEKVDGARAEVMGITDYKKRYDVLSQHTGQSVNSIHKLFLQRFAEEQNSSWTSLINLLKTIESHA